MKPNTNTETVGLTDAAITYFAVRGLWNSEMLTPCAYKYTEDKTNSKNLFLQFKFSVTVSSIWI